MPELAESARSLQRGRVSEPTDGGHGWNGLVCPDCRCVFRVPKEHPGQGVACPSCRRLLRIPGEGDEPPPLVAAGDRQSAGPVSAGMDEWQGPVVTSHGQRRSRSVRSGRTSRREGDPKRMVWILAGLVLVLLILMALLVKILWQPADTEQSVAHGKDHGARTHEKPVLQEQAATDASWFDADEVMRLCRSFVAADSADEILPLIRDAERFAPDVRSQCAAGKVQADQVEALIETVEHNPDHGHALSVHLVAKLRGQCTVHVCRTADGLKVDWPSWVGQSAMSWEEMAERKPVEPFLVRALLSHVEYYNMDFSDDRKWRSFRITSPDGAHVFYAYAVARSAEEGRMSRMAPTREGKSFPATLMIRYPEGAKAGNQVILDRIITGGWLVQDEKP